MEQIVRSVEKNAYGGYAITGIIGLKIYKGTRGEAVKKYKAAVLRTLDKYRAEVLKTM